MRYATNNDGYYDEPDEIYKEDDEEPEKRTWLSRILIVALLAVTGSGSAFAWRAFNLGTAFSSQPGTIASQTNPAGQAQIEELQKTVAASTQSTAQALAAQQAEIKRLADQVGVLTNKLDLLQKPVAAAQGAIPAPAPTAPVSASKQKPEAAKSTAMKPAKPTPAEPRSSEPKPTNGSTSTVGAPLQLGR